MCRSVRYLGVLLLFMNVFLINAQNRKISGVITDDFGLPFAGVTVTSGNENVISDTDGNYSISVASGNESLEFVFIGYETQTIDVTGLETLDVQMLSELFSMNTVVTVGYGSSKKKDVTGAISSISDEQLQTANYTNIDEALQGWVSGASVTRNSGQPGGAVSMRVRGTTSVSGSNEPLYVIDGIPFVGDGDEVIGFSWIGGSNGETKINALSAINPADITNVQVLKDASAAAIYGSRAANGVVLITTRKGENKEPQVRYSGYVASQELPNKLDMLNLKEYAEYKSELADEWGVDFNSYYSDPSLLGSGTDWQDEIFRTATMHSHNITVTGGNEKTNYAFSGGYMKQDGIIIGSDFERFTGRMNLETEIKDWLKFGAVMAYGNTNETVVRNQGYDGVIMEALMSSPGESVYDMDGNYTGPESGENGNVSYNAVALAKLINNDVNRKRFNGSVYFDVNLFKDLKFRTEYSLLHSKGYITSFIPTYEWGALTSNSNARLRDRNSTREAWDWKNYFTYEHNFNGIHDLKIMAGEEAQESYSRYSVSEKANLQSNDPTDGMTADGEASSISGAIDNSTQVSYFGRANYIFREKYLASFTMRADGSSMFGSENRWGYFPSGSLAWRIKEESFMQSVTPVSDLKLRVSYGTVGNLPGETGLYESYMTTVTTAFGTGFVQSGYANSSLKWETTNEANIGIDLGLFDQRIVLSFDAYDKQTKDLLLQVSLPDYVSGVDDKDVQSPYGNVGKMSNKGFDFSISTKNIKNDNFTWSTDIRFSHNVNKVEELNDEDAVYYGELKSGENVTITRAGLPVGVFYGYKANGLYTSEEELNSENAVIPDGNSVGEYGTWLGDIKFENVDDSNNVIDEDDQTVIGDPNPDFTFAMNNSFTYKNFDLSLLLTGSYGADIFNYTRMKTEAQTSLYDNQTKDVLNRAIITGTSGSYTLENPNTDMPRAISSDPNNNNRISSRFIEDGSYVRISNVRLGYNFPEQIVNRLSLQNINVYCAVQNLYTFTDYSGYDPEIGAFGQDAKLQNIDIGRYPSPRTYTFGVNVTF